MTESVSESWLGSAVSTKSYLLTNDQIGAYWDRHLAAQVNDVPDPGAVQQMRARYIQDVRSNPEAVREVAEWAVHQNWAAE